MILSSVIGAVRDYIADVRRTRSGAPGDVALVILANAVDEFLIAEHVAASTSDISIEQLRRRAVALQMLRSMTEPSADAVSAALARSKNENENAASVAMRSIPVRPAPEGWTFAVSRYQSRDLARENVWWRRAMRRLWK